MARDTKQRIIAKAAQMLHQGGYHATGLQQLTASGELPRGSLYFHFPGGKQELACAALEHAGEQLGAMLEETFYSLPSVSASLAAVLRFLGKRSAPSRLSEGCPVATPTLELPA